MRKGSWVPVAVAGVAALLFPARAAMAGGPPVRSPLAVVGSVKENSLAAKSGMRPGDVVVRLNSKKNPSLEEVLAYRFDRENAGDTPLTLKRGKAGLEATLPQGDWGCAFRADLLEEALKRLDEAREDVKKDESWEEGLKKWEILVHETEKGGFRDAALWLRLELAKALDDKRRWEEALEGLDGLERGAAEKGFWAFRAELEKAGALMDAGDNDRAAGAYGRARDLAKECGSELRLAGALSAWFKFEYERGRLTEAKALASEALAIRERLAPGSLSMSASLGNLGNIAWNQGDLATAREYHLKALSIKERLAPGSLTVASSLTNLGLVAGDQGDLAAAGEYHFKALEIRERLAPGSLDVAGCLNNLGMLADDLGDLAAAREYHLKALAIKDRLAPGSIDLARSLNNLALVVWKQGDLASAQEYVLKAQAIKERLAPDSLYVASSLNNSGAIACDQGDLASAREFFLKGLAIQERLAPGSLDVAKSLNNLGAVAFREGDWVASQEYYAKGMAIHERLASGSLSVAMNLNNLGLVAHRRGDLDSAREHFLRALAIQERLAPGSLDAAMSIGNLGAVARDKGDLAAAKEYHLKALMMHERLAPGSFVVAKDLQSLAEVEKTNGNLPRCAELLSKAVDTLEAQRGKAGGESAKTSFSAAHGDFYTDLIAAHLDTKKPESALETLERSRAKALLEMVSSRQIDLAGEVPGALLKMQRDLARQRKALYDKLSEADAKTDPKDIESWRSELLMLPQKEDALAEEIRKVSPRLAALEYPKPLNYAAITSALEPGTLLVAYAVAEQETFLFTLREGSGPKPALKAIRLPIGRKDLENRVRSFRAQLGAGAASSANPDSWKRAGEGLYDALLGPASKEIASCDRIILMPDGPLHLLSFGALLPKGRKALPLGLQKPIAIEPSMTIYAELKERRTAGATPGKGTWTGFGDPSYPAQEKAGEIRGEPAALVTRSFSLSPLPGSRKEIEAISSLFGAEAKTLLGADATEDAVRALPKETPLLHFACHGLIDQAFPMNSALALTPTPTAAPGDITAIGDNRKDGLLQAWEIIQDVKLDSDCVVLSACETGAGKVLGGEGIMGLTRAFFYAGAKSVVVSLWPVSDESTAFLMEHFYKEILGGAPRDVALMRAQLDLFLSGKGHHSRSVTPHSSPLTPDFDYSHPFYWAGFVLNGDWR